MAQRTIDFQSLMSRMGRYQRSNQAGRALYGRRTTPPALKADTDLDLANGAEDTILVTVLTYTLTKIYASPTWRS